MIDVSSSCEHPLQLVDEDNDVDKDYIDTYLHIEHEDRDLSTLMKLGTHAMGGLSQSSHSNSK